MSAPAANPDTVPAILPRTLTVGGRTFALPHVDAMPPLTAAERVRLTADIRAHGIKTPVIVTDADDVPDGHSRLMIAAEMGPALADIPLKVEAGLTAEQARHLATTLNTHRRQLTPEQVREKIAAVLKADPEVSDRLIAAQVQACHKTVGRAWKKLTANGALPQTTRTKGKDGRKRPPAKTKKAPPPTPTAPKPARATDVPEIPVPADSPQLVPRGIGKPPWSRAIEDIDFRLVRARGESKGARKLKVPLRNGCVLAPLSQQLRELATEIDDLGRAQDARNAGGSATRR